ncbi:MAG: hypothetical protein E7311_00225 [Clostridiales bacterium]|nr:hypothetical protein [Clostridiales bacterium]
MKEYCVFVLLNRTNEPMILKGYNNIDSAKTRLYQYIRNWQDNSWPYYVDNDFYNNEYPNIDCKNFAYFCIKERDVTKWEKYSNVNIKYEDNHENNNKCKIINFLDFNI